MSAYKKFWRDAFDFKGNATRKDYWIPALINVAIILCASLIGFSFYGSKAETIMTSFMIGISIFMIILFIPNLSILIRRFHDTGRNMFIPILYMGMSFAFGGMSFAFPNETFQLIINIISLVVQIYMLAITLLPTRRVEPSERQWV